MISGMLLVFKLQKRHNLLAIFSVADILTLYTVRPSVILILCVPL